MIDLHMHTNASDGRCTPADLVSLAASANLTVISVTDHDTFAAFPEVIERASELELRVIPGIEITAMWQGRDVHVLGYFLDPSDERLAAFLERQRADRLRRVREMIERLRDIGIDIAFEDVAVPVAGRLPHSLGRPQVASAIVNAGHASSRTEAFEKYIAEDRPAFVPRQAAPPTEVVRLIVSCGGIASLAHPGLLDRDDLIPELVDSGMQALEVYHPDHDADRISRYLAVAHRYDLAVTGGSDFHADDTHGASLGEVTLPTRNFIELEDFPEAKVWASGISYRDVSGD